MDDLQPPPEDPLQPQVAPAPFVETEHVARQVRASTQACLVESATASLVPGLLDLPEGDRLELANVLERWPVPHLHVAPEVEVSRTTFEDFAAEVVALEARSERYLFLGVDGIVRGRSWVRRLGMLLHDRQVQLTCANFDHHIDSTSDDPSSAVQLLRFLLDEARLKVAPPEYLAFVCNDPDQDVALCHNLLRALPAVLRLPAAAYADVTRAITLQDLLDRYAGMVPWNPADPLLRVNAWVNEPYTLARRSGTFNLPPNATSTQLRTAREETERVLHAVHGRFLSMLAGESQELDVSTAHHPFLQGDQWCVIDETDVRNGDLPAVGAMNAGQRLFLKYRQGEGGLHRYSIIKASRKFLPHDRAPLQVSLPVLFARLNAREGREVWGGSPRCGGCRAGSRLTPDEVADVVEATVSRPQ